MADRATPKAKVMRMEEAFWELPPGHFQAFSKLLVHPTNAATRYFDFRISSYQPRGYAEVHVHEVAENLYYILQPADVGARADHSGRLAAIRHARAR